MNATEESIRSYLNPDAALDVDDERNMRLVLAHEPFDSEDAGWSWKWVCRLLATIDKLRGHVTCFKCGGGEFYGGEVCSECLGDGATPITSASASEATPGIENG